MTIYSKTNNTNNNISDSGRARLAAFLICERVYITSESIEVKVFNVRKTCSVYESKKHFSTILYHFFDIEHSLLPDFSCFRFFLGNKKGFRKSFERNDICFLCKINTCTQLFFVLSFFFKIKLLTVVFKFSY